MALSQIDRSAYQNYLFPMPFPKNGISYKAAQPMAAGVTHADDKGTLSRRTFCPCGNACGKCLGLERQACVATMREVCRLSRLGKKEMGWYENGTRDC